MKRLPYKWIIPVFISLLIVACSKENSVTERQYLSELQGTYEGNISINNQYTAPATAEVSVTTDDQLKIQCYDEILDTTIFMDAYENGDSIMLCYTDSNFYNEYGHMSEGYHMMDMMDNETEWSHHLNTHHMAGDEHNGSFSMMNNSCDFSFSYTKNDSIQEIEFHGIK